MKTLGIIIGSFTLFWMGTGLVFMSLIKVMDDLHNCYHKGGTVNVITHYFVFLIGTIFIFFSWLVGMKLI